MKNVVYCSVNKYHIIHHCLFSSTRRSLHTCSLGIPKLSLHGREIMLIALFDNLIPEMYIEVYRYTLSHLTDNGSGGVHRTTKSLPSFGTFITRDYCITGQSQCQALMASADSAG